MPAKTGSSTRGKGQKAIRPLTVSDGLDFIQQVHESEDAANDMIQLILNKGAEILYMHYISEKSNENCALETINNVIDAVELQLAPHDEGEFLSHVGEQRESWSVVDEDVLESLIKTGDIDLEETDVNEPVGSQLWTCEEEPNSCEIDRWASGVVPLMSRPASPRYRDLLNYKKPASVNADDNVSVAGSLRSRKSRGNRSSIFNASASTKGISTRPSRETVVEEDIKKPQKIPIVRTQHEIELEKIRHHELARIEKKRRLIERKRLQRQRQEDEEKRYEAVKKELRGKNYTFDEKGDVVVINPINGDRMSSVTFGPKIKVVNENKENQSSNKTSFNAHRPPRTHTQKKQQQPVENDSVKFVEIGVVQPPISEIAQLAHGVTLRHGANVRSGNKNDNANDREDRDPKNMSFKEYSQMLDTMVEGERQQQKLYSELNLRPNDSFEESDTSSLLQERKAQMQKIMMSPSEKAKFDNADDYDNVVTEEEGDIDIHSSRQQHRNNNNNNNNNMTFNPKKNGKVSDRTAKNILFNTSILSNSSWGQNPGPSHKSRVNPLPYSSGSGKKKDYKRRTLNNTKSKVISPREIYSPIKQNNIPPRLPVPSYAHKRPIGKSYETLPQLNQTDAAPKYSFNATKKPNVIHTTNKANVYF